MPTFLAIQLDQLLETATTAKTTSLKSNYKDKKVVEDSFPNLERRNSTSSSSSRRSGDVPPPYPQLRRGNSVSVTPTKSSSNSNGNNSGNTARRLISPALYTTPEPTPIPMSPNSSFPPSSPYIIDHKRRGPRLSKSFSDENIPSPSANVAEVGRTRSLSEENVVLERTETVDEVNGDVVAEVVAVVDENGGGSGEVGEGEDFFDPQDMLSFSSSNDAEDYGGERSAKAANTPMGEFYDAWEELSSDSGRQGAQRSLSDIETELREMRLTLFMEIEKRKQVEESEHSMQRKWQILREKLGTVGVVLPAELPSLEDKNQPDAEPIEDICRQIHLARFVSESIGRGMAKAEVEAEMEAQLEVKNFEIARLCDRLHYYEIMNREMSQRNQEAIEVARRDRQKKRRRQKWIWGSIATAITVGSAALAWSYLPSTKGSPPTKTLEVSEPESDLQ